MTRINRTVPAVFVFLVAAGLLFAGGQEEAAPAQFEFWTTETQSERVSTIQLLVDTFQALNPQLQITVVPVDENDVPKQVAASSAAGTLPALAEFGSELAIDFGSEGLLDMELTTDIIKAIGKSKYYAGTLKLLESPSRGLYYALPYHGWVQGIWYRSDWFKDAGLKAPDDWEAIEKAAKHFYQPGKNQYGILVGTKAEVYSEQCFTQIAISNKARLFDKDGNLVFNSPAMKEAIEYYANLAQYNPPGPQTWRARDYYLQGKMAMFFYSTYIMDDLALQEAAAGSLTSKNFPELTGAAFDPDLANKTGFASKIRHKQPSSYGVIVALALFNQKDEAKSQGARRFVDFLYEEDNYVTFLHMAPGGMNPVLKAIATSDKFMDDPSGLFARYGKEKMGEIISGLESIQRFGIVEGNLIEAYGTIFSQQIIPQMIYKITQEKMDVAKAMDWAEGEMRKAMK
jgi:multiple sugar transport system substrate-binding protein